MRATSNVSEHKAVEVQNQQDAKRHKNTERTVSPQRNHARLDRYELEAVARASKKLDFSKFVFLWDKSPGRQSFT